MEAGPDLYRRLLRSALTGVAAGLAASWVMEQFQSIVPAPSTGNDGPSHEPSTVKAADALSEAATGEPVPGAHEAAAGSAVHYGFGAFLGALYGGAGEVVPGVRAGFGTAFGASVAIVADEALVPAMRLAPPPQNVDVSTHVYGMASHLVFGMALEGSRRVIDRAVFAATDDRGRSG